MFCNWGREVADIIVEILEEISYISLNCLAPDAKKH